MTPATGPVTSVAGPLAVGWMAIRGAVDKSAAAPLSARQALHAAVLIDQFSDRAFDDRAALAVAQLAVADDRLAFRAALRHAAPALGQIMDLTRCGADSPRLEVVATSVAPDAFARLAVADLMVSLYSGGTVPRLMLVLPGAQMLPMQDVLQDALAWWADAIDASVAAEWNNAAPSA